MFPLPILTYVKLGICVAVLAFSWYLGFSFERSRFMAYKADQIAQTQKLEKEYQAAADKIESEKNAQIRTINNQLVDAISELRKRPSRAQSAGNGQGGTGLSLSAEDSIFLEREAARADILRTALSACYQQYDSLK
jgi:hypothetical protein